MSTKSRLESLSHKALPPLEFGRAQHQADDHAQVDLFHRIIQSGADHLRILQLFFECGSGLRRRLIRQQDLDGAVERSAGIGRGVLPQQRGRIHPSAAHAVGG